MTQTWHLSNMIFIHTQKNIQRLHQVNAYESVSYYINVYNEYYFSHICCRVAIYAYLKVLHLSYLYYNKTHI